MIGGGMIMRHIYTIKTCDDRPLEAVLEENGLFLVSGTGVNEEFLSPDDVPWKDERGLLRMVRFADEVPVQDLTNWFWGCENLEEVVNWPKSVVKMQATCCDCHRLVKLPAAFPAGLQDLDEAFIRCYALASAPEIPAGVVYMADTFADCFSLSGHVVFRGVPTQFAFVFQNAGKDGDGVVVDYAPGCESVVDALIATKDSGKVSKGIVK